MIMIAFLMAAQAVPASVLDEADAANDAYVGCLLAISRSADGAGLSVTEYERKLAVSCWAEERVINRIDTKLFTLRGHRGPAREADALNSETRQSMVDTYRRLPEFKNALKQIEEVCRADPAQCRQ